MNYSLLQQLLAAVERFEAQQTAAPGGELMEFAQWLYAQTTPTPEPVDVRPNAVLPGDFTEKRITKLLTYVYRYARSYARLALDGSPLLAIDDVTYLATVQAHQPLTKSALIARNIHEKSSGTEVIKRLLKRGFLLEQMHETDRRRRLLSVSPSGEQALLEVLERMGQKARMVAGNLEPAERQQLLYLLLKLDSFHHPIFLNRSPTFVELLNTYFPQLQPLGSLSSNGSA